METGDQITRQLQAASAGDPEALEEVAAWAYRHLERYAASRMRRQFGTGLPGVTLEPAALVNETFLKLLEQPRAFANRRHFFAFASQVMVRVLVDYHRRRGAAKRGGEAVRVTLSELHATAETDIPVLVTAMEELARLDPRKAEVVNLKVFWGCEMAEIAELVDASKATVERDWRFARSWLAERLRSE